MASPQKSERQRKQEKQQADAWLKTFMLNKPSTIERLCSFLPNMAHNEYLGSTGSRMLDVMIKNRNDFNPQHHHIFDALMAALERNPHLITPFNRVMTSPDYAWLSSQHIPSISSALVTVYHKAKPKWKAKLFEWMVENPDLYHACKERGFNDSETLYALHENQYHDMLSHNPYGQSIRNTADWFTSLGPLRHLDVSRVKEPHYFYELVLAQATPPQIQELWAGAVTCGVTTDFTKAWVRQSIQALSPSMMNAYLSTTKPDDFWWGMMLRTVDAVVHGRTPDGLEHARVYQEVWPDEYEWLEGWREVQLGLGDEGMPVLDSLRAATSYEVFSRLGKNFKIQWELSHQKEDVLLLPDHLDVCI